MISLGDRVLVAAGVSFIAHDMSDTLLNGIEHTKSYKYYRKEIVVGSNVLIGSRVTILPGKHIGNNCIIGSGSVVSKDVPDGCVAAGNPIRIIGSFEEFATKRMEYSKGKDK